MTNISKAERDAINKKTAALLQRLLLDSCRTQTRIAVQNEGPLTVQYAFQVLGQVASHGLFMDPQVLQGVKDLNSYIDQEKLKQLLASPETQLAPAAPGTPAPQT